MNVLRASCSALAVLVVSLTFGWSSAQAQVPAPTIDFDSRPSGFLTEKTGGMPADAWNGTSLATAKRLVSSLQAAPRSRALRDLQFKLLVSDVRPPASDGSPPPSLFARKVDRLAAMGEAESLNEIVRSIGGYADPALAAATVNALMMAGEKDSACQIVRTNALAEPFGRRASTVCKLVAGDNGGAGPGITGAIRAGARLRLSEPGFNATPAPRPRAPPRASRCRGGRTVRARRSHRLPHRPPPGHRALSCRAP